MYVTDTVASCMQPGTRQHTAVCVFSMLISLYVRVPSAPSFHMHTPHTHIHKTCKILYTTIKDYFNLANIRQDYFFCFEIYIMRLLWSSEFAQLPHIMKMIDHQMH